MHSFSCCHLTWNKCWPLGRLLCRESKLTTTKSYAFKLTSKPKAGLLRQSQQGGTTMKVKLYATNGTTDTYLGTFKNLEQAIKHYNLLIAKLETELGTEVKMITVNTK